MRIICLASLALSISACHASLPEGVFGCESADDCPGGWVCRDDGLCWANASTAGDAQDDGANAGGDAPPAGDTIAGDAATGDPNSGDGAPRCDDGSQNGGESDVDCGAVCPTRCASGQHCGTSADCATGQCVDHTCVPPAENCFDSVDNDGDDDIDCADSDCVLIGTCVPAVTPPFTGYYRVRPDAFGTLVNLPCRDGGDAARYLTSPRDAVCEPCTCDLWMDATCGTAELYCDADGGCDQNTRIALSGFDCIYRPFAGLEHLSCFVEPAPVLNEGTCTPGGGGMTPSEMWGGVLDVCGGEPVGAGCGAGACAPIREPSYEGFCVIADGTHDCPASFPDRRLIHADGEDKRDCSSCECPVTMACTGATFHINDGVSCSTNDPHIPNFAATTCTDVGWVTDGGYGTWSVKRATYAAPSGGCTHAGGEPIGTIQPSGTQTVCCQ